MPDNFTVTVLPEEKKVVFKLNNFNQEALDAIHFRLVEGANNIRNKMINKMRRTPKTGKRYKRGKKWHIASSPGNAPAVDTGQALRSIVMEDRLDAIEVGFKSGAPYMAALEDGATGTGRSRKGVILPRPVLAPSVNSEAPRIERRILNDLESMKL